MCWFTFAKWSRLGYIYICVYSDDPWFFRRWAVAVERLVKGHEIKCIQNQKKQ